MILLKFFDKKNYYIFGENTHKSQRAFKKNSQ